MAGEIKTVLKHFQIFRNASISSSYSTYTEALTAAKKAWESPFVTDKGLKDGEFVLFNYRLGQEATKVESILGIVREGAIDIIGSYDQLTTEYQAAINALNADKSGSNTKQDITVQVVETAGKITEVKVTDKLANVAHSGAAADVAIADEGNIIAATTVEGALAEVMTKANTLQAAQLSAGTGIEIGTDNKINANFDIAIETRTGENAGEYIVIKDGETVIAEVNANAFVKDGFLASVSKDPQTNELVFTWNTDVKDEEGNPQVTRIAIQDLCDVYTVGEGLVASEDGYKFSHQAGAEGLTANTVFGSASASDNKITVKVPSVTVDEFGHVSALTDNEVSLEIPASVASAVQTVTGDTYVSATKTGTDVTLTTKTKAVADATADAEGLATAHSVKTYVDTNITNAIAALDAEETSADGINVQVKVTEVDGKITAVNVTTDNTVNSNDVNTAITTAINALDGTATIATIANDVVTLKAGIAETDGKIANSTATDITLAKVATTGKADDVSIADAGNIIAATTVEGALQEIAAEIDKMDSSLATTAESQVNKLVKLGYTQEDGVITSLTSDETALENRLQGLQNATTLEGVDAIDVSYGTGDDSTNTVSLKLANETILTQDENGLKATLNLTYDSTVKEIRLWGTSATEPLAKVNATDFIKDGMLADAEIITATDEEGLETGERYIKFTFKTYQYGVEGEEILKVEYLPVEDLFDSYTEGNEWIVIDQATNKISHKTVDNLDSTNSHGIVDNVTVDSTATQTFQVPTLKVDAAGHVVSVDEKTVTITLPAEINTAIQSGAGVDTTYIKTTVVRNATNTNQLDVTATAVIGDYAAEGQVEGLATTSATKTYVETYVDGKIDKVNTTIADLDVANVSVATVYDGIVTFNGIKQEDGKIATGTTGISLEKVATTGAAADVTYTRVSDETTTNMTVQQAISDLEAVDTWDAGTY